MFKSSNGNGYFEKDIKSKMLEEEQTHAQDFEGGDNNDEKPKKRLSAKLRR